MDLFGDGHGLTSFEPMSSGKRFIVACVHDGGQRPNG
jgi:hypothetical protein